MNNAQMIVNMMMNSDPNIKNNPILQNAIQLAQSGNTTQLQQMAQNLCNEKGIDINSAMNQVKQQFGI